MQQILRRQLLALGTLSGDQTIAEVQCRTFIDSVLAVTIDIRPSTTGVNAVLQSNRARANAIARFLAAFEAAL